MVGALVALGGAVLASVEERRRRRRSARARSSSRSSAAVALGLFVYFLGLGSREGDALSTLLGARVGSLGLLSCSRSGDALRCVCRARSITAVAAVGVADVSANALFAFASGHGLLALVSVLGSLYPVVTRAARARPLGERLTRAQQAGVAIALAGVVAIAAA